MLSSLKEFVNDIEEHIYKKELIYRSLLVIASDREGLLLKKELQNRDYSVLFIDSRFEISSVDDYDKISNRIVVISSTKKFREFINHLKLSDTSFNFIGFSYNIENTKLNDMLYFYVYEKTENNKYDTIIYDKNYRNLLYLNSIRK
jgi:hypothetical protein